METFIVWLLFLIAEPPFLVGSVFFWLCTYGSVLKIRKLWRQRIKENRTRR